MSTNYHHGDQVTQHGPNSIGIIKNQGSGDPQAAFSEMIKAAHSAQGKVSAADLQSTDGATIATDNAEKQPVRGALGTIAKLATMVSQAGVPVIEAVRKMMGAFTR